MQIEILQVSVTSSDIEQGKRYHSSACPIALAAQRATGAGTLVFVTPAMLVVRTLEGDCYYPLPRTAQAFQTRFDRATWDDTDPGLEPFSFEVRWDRQGRFSFA